MGWGSSVFPLLIVTSSGGFTGLFVYSPTPGAGHLLASIAAANGTDPYGNAYLAGVTAYQSSGGAPLLSVQLSAGSVVFNSAPTQAGPWTFVANVFADGAHNLNFSTSGSGIVRSSEDLAIITPGSGLRVREGSNAKQGTATLAAGTVVVANTSVTANSRIFLTPQDNNSTGALRVSARTAGTSFTITSSNAADTGVVGWEIFEPG